MYSQHDERSSNARGSTASSGHQQQHHSHNHASDHGQGRGFHRYLGSYGSSSTPSSSLENQRSLEAQLSASTVTTSSLFGDPVLPAARHADLLGGEDLYQNLKSNIELYHAKLFSEQERHRQAERDALFDQYAHGGGTVAGSAVERPPGSGYRAQSATGGSGSGSGSTAGSAGIGSGRGPKSSVGHNVMAYGEVPPRSRNFSRTQSAGLGVDLSALRSNVLDMDLLKQNDWIDFSEHEYRHSLIPTTSRTVADVQQFAGANIPRKIENGVFQNPRAAAAARASRRNSLTSESAGLYGSVAHGDHPMPPGSTTFTVLGHGHPDGAMHDFSTSSETNSEYERMLRYGRTDPSTAIIRDKINTGSNNRVSDARQHKNTAFTIINEVLPKSSSFDMTGSMRYSPYREKHRVASSRILSASSAFPTAGPVGFYGYGQGYGSEYAEEGSVSTVAAAHPGMRRRFSSSELSLGVGGLRKADGSGGSGTRSKRPAKAKTSLSMAGRRQPGVLEVMSKKSSSSAVPSAKVTITQPSEDGRSLTPTPSETSGLSAIESDRISIPEHQLRNLKLFGYKPFSGGRALSPVPDKSSMENSQADLKLDSGSSGGGGAPTAKKGPVFNIRGLLMSPRQREKAKESKAAELEGAGVVTEQPSSRSQSKEPTGAKEQEGASPAAGSPPKKRRFNLARAIIESARGGGGGAPEAEKSQPKATAAQKESVKEGANGDAGDGGNERRSLAMKMKLGIVRSGVRKDSEGNGVKEKKGKGGKKGAAGASSAKGAKKQQTKLAPSAKGGKKGPTSKARGRKYDDGDDDDDDPYGHDRDDYGASYGRRGLDLGPKKGAQSKKGGTGGGGMLKSALSYAASFRSRSDRVGTAAVGGRSKQSTGGPEKGATGGRAGPRAGKDTMEKLTPNARRREKSAKAQGATMGDGRGKSGTRQTAAAAAGARVKSGKSPARGGTNRAKSAAGQRGKTLRRSSSALALDAGQQRKMNKLYEKNQKASGGTGGGLLGLGGRGGKSTSSLISKANRQSNEGNASSGAGAGSSGGALSKSDSRGELRGKGASKMMAESGDGSGGGGGSDTRERFEKRDSDRSLKKSDSNKSLATMGGKPKKSDSKSSLLTKRSDSRSSLHQTAAGAGGSDQAGGNVEGSGAEMSGKSPFNEATAEASGVKSARPTPKLQSKGSLLSLISLKGSRRNLDRAGAAGGAEGGAGQRPDTAASMVTAADGTMASSTSRLKSASMRNAPPGAAPTGEGAGGEDGAAAAGAGPEKPMSTKPLRRLMSRGSLLSIKSIAHARSFTNIRPPTAAGADGAGGGGAGGGGAGGGDGVLPQTGMTKVTEGSQEHDDTTDTETSHGGGMGAGMDGQGSMGVATHELTVAGDGEGEKVSNEYNGDRMRSPMADHRQQKPGSRSPDMDNVSSANTESLRDRTTGQEQQHAGGGATSNSDEFDEDEQLKCSKCCCACCAPCWTRTCLPFRRCFRSCCSGCCGARRKRKADGQLASKGPAPAKDAHVGEGGDGGGEGCWSRLLGCCRRCRNSKTSPETALVPKGGPAAGRAPHSESTPKKSCWQSLNCCASCRRNKSRELVPRSSIDSDPPAEEQSRCRSCWSKLLCCCRPKPDHAPPGKSNIKRTRMAEKEPVEMETVKCCFCFKRQRPKVKAKPKRKVPVKSTFNCFSCCMMCCRKKGDNQSRRTSNLSKKQSIAPTIPPEDLRPKIDMSLVEHSSLMRGAIPVLPLCLAYFCLLLNVLLPGTGTVLSGGLCLCIGKPRFSQHDSIKGRIGSFIINCIVGVSQCFTIIFCVVGWGWAIWWGTIMLRLAKQHQKILEMEAAQEEAEDQTTLSQRTGASNPPVALVSKTHRDVETGR